MNFAQLCYFLLLLCALTFAQGNDGFSESPSCYANMCERLDKFDALQSQIQELRNKVTTPVIFSAATGGGDTAIGPFNTETTLIFQRVMTNIGNAYNSATGVFAAPHNGVYYFTFFFHAGWDHRTLIYLMKNNERIVETHDHKSTYDTADNGGNAVFLQLQQGDQVFIRMKADTHVWGGDYTTTFSGFLVSQM